MCIRDRANAGPLNSVHVIARALQELHALSPKYLDACMAHLDALMVLEQATGTADVQGRAAAPRTPKQRLRGP